MKRVIDDLPRILFLGPHVGRTPGYITTQGEVLLERLTKAGYPVAFASSRRNRYARLMDIAATAMREAHRAEAVLLDIYAEASFVVEDLASVLVKHSRTPLVMVLHGGTIPEFASRYPRWFSRVLSRADALVAPSPFMARAVSRWGFEAQTIPNVIAIEDCPFRLRESVAPRLLWMRSFYGYYHPEVAVHALAAVRRELPTATLVMAGRDKGLERETRDLARALGLERAVEFPGFLDKTGKNRYFSECDIFVNTNAVDNMPVAVLEACASGLPVVTTDAGGLPDMLAPGDSGLLVPVGDHHAMADAVVRLVRDAELTRRLSSNGRTLAERSSWPSVHESWKQLFRQLQEGWRQPAGSRGW